MAEEMVPLRSYLEANKRCTELLAEEEKLKVDIATYIRVNSELLARIDTLSMVIRQLEDEIMRLRKLIDPFRMETLR